MVDTIAALLHAALPLSIVVVFATSGVVARNADAPGTTDLQRMIQRFAPVDIGADVSGLPPSEREALRKLVEASRIIDALFLRQVWAGNEALLLRLLDDRSALGEARLRYFLINKGPWSRLDGDAPFIPGVGPRPGGANFYAPGATRDEVERWIAQLPEADRARATGFFTTIRRSDRPDGSFVAVPYSLEYQPSLELAAMLLRDAAAATREPTLQRTSRPGRRRSCRTTTTRATSRGWSSTAALEPTIGPYEVYEDEWFNYKAAFESFITVRDDQETAKLERFSRPAAGHRGRTCRSTRRSATRRSARWRRFAS
jgi:hypothetical protein